MDTTLERDLRAVAQLYTWVGTALGKDLDAILQESGSLAPRHLDTFVTWLRSLPTRSENLTALATVSVKLGAIRLFLSWACDPRNQGVNTTKRVSQIAEQRLQLQQVFQPFMRYGGRSERIEPLSPSQVQGFFELVGPIRERDGRISVPLSFCEDNPFRTQNRVRNWLMFSIAYRCGLRRGELLKLRIDDIPKPNDPGLKVRRRPHDRSDSRRHKPRVKTSERMIPITDDISFGLRIYLSAAPPDGRPGGKTPYLFVSQTGSPLSITAADEIVEVAARHSNLSELSWHTFRHTWAEELADELLHEYSEEQALAYIRQLGGWRPTSSTPMHYIQNALAKKANEFLRARNARLYEERK